MYTPLVWALQVYRGLLRMAGGSVGSVSVCVKKCLFDADGAGVWPEAAAAGSCSSGGANTDGGSGPIRKRPALGDVLREPRAALGLCGLLRGRGHVTGGENKGFVNPLLRVNIRRTSKAERAKHGFAHELIMVYRCARV
jgi:hypothetical protein